MKYYLPSIVVIILDQFTKVWVVNNLQLWESFNVIGQVLRFTHVKNTGLAFGIPVGQYKILLVILSIFATLYIAYLHWNERNNHPLIFYSLSLILGGAVGNLIDRSYIFFVENYLGVVDFIDIGYKNYRWYTFNIADSAVTLGIILYLIYSLLQITEEAD